MAQRLGGIPASIFRLHGLRTAQAAALLLAAFILGVTPARAQDAYAVAGVVSAADGTAVRGATIELFSHGTFIRAASDGQGRFVFARVGAGTYDLRAFAPGYTTLSERTVTVAGGNKTLTIVLARATPGSLTVIGQVRAGARESVSNASAPSLLLDAQNAAARGITQVSQMLSDELSTTPVFPVGAGRTAPASYALRGPDPTETRVNVDGHPVNNGNTGDFDLSLVDPAALQSVQVVYGIAPSSLVGPDTIGGAINLLTLQPTTAAQTLLRAFGGSHGDFGETFQTTGTRGALGYAVSLHQTASDGDVNAPVLDAASGTEQHVGSSSDGTSMLAKLRYSLAGGYGYAQVDLRDASVAKDLSALLTAQNPDGTIESAAGTAMGAHQSNYGFDLQMPLGACSAAGPPLATVTFSHLTSLAAQSVWGPLAGSSPYLFNQRDVLGDDWVQFDRRMGSGDLAIKLDVATESLTTDFPAGGTTTQSLRRTSAQGSPPSSPPIALGQTQRAAVVRYSGDAGVHVHYSLATYFSDFSTFGSSFDPRAGVAWTPSSATAVRASVGTTFQTPQLSELVVPPPALQVPIDGVITIGNPHLGPDHATEYDLGADRIFGSSGREVRLSFDVYETNLRAPANQLVVAPVPGCGTATLPCPYSYPVNAGDGIYRGAVVRVQSDIGAHVRVRAGWDVDSSFLTKIPPSIQDGTLVPYQQSLGEPLHKAYAAFDAGTGRLHFGAQLDALGAYNELNRAPFATLQAHVSWDGPQFDAELYGTNLTNTYADPFTVTGGAAPAYVLPARSIVLVLTKRT